jgi:hypothetical protein
MESAKYAVEFITIDGTMTRKFYKTKEKAIKRYSKYLNNMGFYYIIRIVDLDKEKSNNYPYL